MATFNFSTLTNGQVIVFNPNTDVLNFDVSTISAADLSIFSPTGFTDITALGKAPRINNLIMF